jgi:Excalibur calcium-binding domain
MFAGCPDISLRRRVVSLVVALIAAFVCAAQLAGPASATICADGSYSSSTGPGTCSHHGGIASSGSPTTPTAGDKDCPDFATQGDAQAYFLAHGGSATNNVDNLDADHDGIACEDNPSGAVTPPPVVASPPPPVVANCGPLPVTGPPDGALLPYGSSITLTATGTGSSDFVSLTIAPAASVVNGAPTLSVVGSTLLTTISKANADGVSYTWSSSQTASYETPISTTPGSYAWQMNDLMRGCGPNSPIQRFTIAQPLRCAMTARRDGAMVELRFCPVTKQVTIALNRSQNPASSIRKKTVPVAIGKPATVRMHTSRRARWVRISYTSGTSLSPRLLGAARIR